MRTKAEQMQAITSFVSIWSSLGMIATPATPQGVVNARWLMERHADALEIALDDDAYDLSSIAPHLPQPEMPIMSPGGMPQEGGESSGIPVREAVVPQGPEDTWG